MPQMDVLLVYGCAWTASAMLKDWQIACTVRPYLGQEPRDQVRAIPGWAIKCKAAVEEGVAPCLAPLKGLRYRWQPVHFTIFLQVFIIVVAEL